jgi:hypothetical protein
VSVSERGMGKRRETTDDSTTVGRPWMFGLGDDVGMSRGFGDVK